MAKKTEDAVEVKEVVEVAKAPEVSEFRRLVDSANAARPDARSAGSGDSRGFEEGKKTVYTYIDSVAHEKGVEHPEVAEMRRVAHLLLR